MRIGESRTRILSRLQQRVLAGVAAVVVILVLVSLYTQLSYSDLRALVVGNTIHLSSRADGRITEIFFRENEPFRRGAVLVRLSNDALRAEIEAVEHEVEEITRSLALERSGQGLERRRYELEQVVTEAELKLDAARIGIESIDIISGAVEERRLRTAARLERAKELVAEGAMTAAELELRRAEAVDAARDHQDIIARRRVLASEVEKHARLLEIQRQRLENLESDRTSVITELELQLADRQGELKRLRKLWDELTLVANHDGIVTSVMRKPGENVPSGTPILTVMTGDELWVEAYLPPGQKRSVHPGDPVQILGSDPAAGRLAARVDRILPVLQPFPAEYGPTGSGNYAVLVITLDDRVSSDLLSPAEEVRARLHRGWSPFELDAAARDRRPPEERSD